MSAPPKERSAAMIAIYARKSVERENSISCETQIEYCMAMLKPEERDEKILKYIDNGFSGGNVNRDGFRKMIHQIEQGKISKVLVYRLDRISRSLSDFVNILETFKQNDVEFVSTQEAFDTGSPYGEIIVKILAVFAKFDRNSIIQRVTQAYEHRSDMCFYMGGRRPYGFDLEPTTINNIKTKKLKPIQEEIDQIKYIFEAYAVENVSLGRIQKNLIANGIKPLTGKGWTTAKLSGIIRNPLYVMADNRVYEYYQKYGTKIINPPEAFNGVNGVQLYGKTKHNPENTDWSDMKIVVMTHEGVIPSELWLKCQQKLAKNKQIGNAVSNKTSWLGGKIACAKCGRTMTTIKGKMGNGDIRRYFTCTGKTHHKDCTGTKKTVYAESLENMIYNEIGRKLESLKAVKPTEHIKAYPELNELRNKLKSIEIAEGQLANTLMRPEVNSDLLEILSKRATKLKNEKAEILIKIEELEENAIDVKTAINFKKQWKTASYEEKRGVASILIHRILISEDGTTEIVWNI